MSSVTPNYLPSEIVWADQVASKLRLIMSTCADETAENRQAYAEEHIRQRLEEVPPAKRTLYLDELATKFPIGQSAPAGLATSPAPAAGAAPVEDVDEFLRVMDRAAARWNDADKEKVRARLATLGVVDRSVGGGLEQHVVELKQRLSLAPAEEVSAAKLAKLCIQQAEFYAKLDQLAWNTWKILAPKSALKRDTALGDSRNLIRRYLRGDAEPNDLQVAQQVERTRQLIAVLLGSISQVSRGFVKRYQTRYSPEAIRDMVKMEGGGSLLTSVEARCWRKYSELAAEINESALQTEMQEVVVKYVEELMRGSNRPT